MYNLLILTLFAAPLYAWSFSVFGLQTNFLMLWIGIVVLAFMVWVWHRKLFSDFWKFSLGTSKFLLGSILLFFIAGVMSTFVGGLSSQKLGQFIVLFLEPVTFFFVARYLFYKHPEKRHHFTLGAYAFVFITGAYAILQYFTLVGVPMPWWGNHVEPRRSLSFFIHPNFYALFVGPLLAFLIPDLVKKLTSFRERNFEAKNVGFIFFWIVGAVGLLFSLSRGSWIGLAFATLVYVALKRSKWFWWYSFIGLVAVLNIMLAVPSVRYRLAAPFVGEKSSSTRVSLWEGGMKMIEDSPILGQGLLSFSKLQPQYISSQDVSESHPTPHNLFIHSWLETGLLGFLGLLGILLYSAYQLIWQNKSTYALSVGLAIMAIVAHGSVDTPYFKNDLAVIFWLILSLI